MKALLWSQCVIGVWLFFSPWLLQFYQIDVARWSTMAGGLAVTILALWGTFGNDTSGTNENKSL